MRTKCLLLVVSLSLCSAPHLAAAEVREYLLGDIDGLHYDGLGSVDDVYVDSDMLAFLRAVAPREPNDHFDVLNCNNNVPFTFLFPLAPGGEVTGATLTLGLRATESLVTTDWLVISSESIVDQWVYWFRDLGWLPLPFDGTSVRSVNLADILGDNRLLVLQDGEFNAYITDDTAVDWARLTIEVIPEPATVSLLALGMLALVRRGRPWRYGKPAKAAGAAR